MFAMDRNFRSWSGVASCGVQCVSGGSFCAFMVASHPTSDAALRCRSLLSLSPQFKFCHKNPKTKATQQKQSRNHLPSPVFTPVSGNRENP